MIITAEPRSDQWNADDFMGGPRTFTITGVKAGRAEQKYDIELAEGEGRVWRPPLTILRVLISAWGNDADVWVGRRVTLYRDPTIRFGNDQVGGIRVSHLSNIDGEQKIPVTVSRGKRALYVVKPLNDPAVPTEAQIKAADDRDQLRAWWNEHHGLRAAIQARVAELDELKQDAEPSSDEDEAWRAGQ